MRIPKNIPALIEVKESSNVMSMSYDSGTYMLYVMYRPRPTDTEGVLYRYVNVPISMWRRLQRTPSKGTFMWTNIKDRFNYSKWTGSAWKGQSALQKASAKLRRDAAKENARLQ
jgi:hypothetical protein